MVAKFVVVVHNRKWGDHYKEFDKKNDAIRYRAACNCDMNTYAFLYKYIEVKEKDEAFLDKEDAPFVEAMKEEKVQETEPDPLKDLSDELNKAHKEYLRIYKDKGSKNSEYKEAKNRYMELSKEYQKKFKKTLKSQI